MKIECADALVLLDNKTGFNAYMRCEEAQRIQEAGGLLQAGNVSLYETTDRQIPDSLKDGEALITDVLIKLQPNIAQCLN